MPCPSSSFDQEGNREHFKGVLPCHVVVLPHIKKDSLLIGELLVLLHAIVELYTLLSRVHPEGCLRFTLALKKQV